VGAVAECQQCGGGVLSTDDNFAKKGEEVGLVEMNDDVVAPSARASSHVNSFLIKRKQANKQMKKKSLIYSYRQNVYVSAGWPIELMLLELSRFSIGLTWLNLPGKSLHVTITMIE